MTQFASSNQNELNMDTKQEVIFKEGEVIEFDAMLSLLSKNDQTFYKDLLIKKDDLAFKKEVYDVLKYEFVNNNFKKDRYAICDFLPFFKQKYRVYWETLFKEESDKEIIAGHIDSALTARKILLLYLFESNPENPQEFHGFDYEQEQFEIQSKCSQEVFLPEIKSTSKKYHPLVENKEESIQILNIDDLKDSKLRIESKEMQRQVQSTDEFATYNAIIRGVEDTIERLSKDNVFVKKIEPFDVVHKSDNASLNKPNGLTKFYTVGGMRSKCDEFKRQIEGLEVAYKSDKALKNKLSTFEGFFITNTAAWQQSAHELRQKALEDLFALLEQLDSDAKTDLINFALKLDLFSEHRSNGLHIFETTAVQTLKAYKNNENNKLDI